MSQDLPLHMVCHPDSHNNEEFVAIDSRARCIIEEAYPSAVWQLTADRAATPLHILLQHQPNLALVQKFLDAAQSPTAGEDNDSILRLQDSQGQLPLHVAIERLAPSDVILRLLELYTEAARVSSKGEMLPLHLLALNRCRYENVLRAVLKENIMAVEGRTMLESQTPLHILFHPEDSVMSWGMDDDLIDPSDMVRTILKAYHSHYESYYQNPDNKTRRRGRAATNVPLQNVKRLVRQKNVAGYTVVKQAEACLDMVQDFFGKGSPKLMESFLLLKEISNGVNVFKNETEQEDEEST